MLHLMQAQFMLLLWFACSLLPLLSAAQPPQRRGPPLPPADRPRPPVDRPHRSGGQPLPNIAVPCKFCARPGPQVGLNFVRFFWDDSRRGPAGGLDVYQPGTIFRDLAGLGATAYRQFVKADLLWDLVESADGQWTFANADAVIPNAAFIPIPTLFAMQYASPTPPWETDPANFQKTLGPEARDYLETVVRRYAAQVKYWEIGNEMEHWRIADPGDGGLARARQTDRVPDSRPADGFSPKEQGKFLAQAAAIVRANDPDAVIVLPGLAGLDDYSLDTWLPGVIEGGGKDWFDIVNYHFYSNWESFVMRRPRLAAAMKRLGIADKPVWQTETGSTSDPSLDIRTDYPNSPETQAADVFRRIVQGYGFGDSLVVWHCYLPPPNGGQRDWRAYGVRDPQGRPTPAGRAFQLLTSELLPWVSAERLEADPRARNLYRFTLADGARKIVAWGSGDYPVPQGFSQCTSVIASPSGEFNWRSVQPGDTLPLTPNPLLLK